MAVKEVIRMGHPTLRLEAQPLSAEEMVSDEIKALVQDMYDTMEEQQGIGIAAPQIDVSKQIALIGIPNDNERYPDAPEYDIVAVINPIITPLTEEVQGFWEGCLSVPGLRGFVERPNKIQVEYFDLKGNQQKIEVEGFVATIFQHEIDHLTGHLYLDRVKDPTKVSYNEEYEKYWTEQSPEDKD